MRKSNFPQRMMAICLAAAVASASIGTMPAYAQSSDEITSSYLSAQEGLDADVAEAPLDTEPGALEAPIDTELSIAETPVYAAPDAIAARAADDVPDTPGEAQDLPIGEEVRYGIQAEDAWDYFKFTTPDNGEIFYFLTVSNRGDNGIVVDVNSGPDFVDAEMIQKNGTVDRKGTQIYRLQKLAAGHTYYVRVRKSWSGYAEEIPYTLRLTQEEDDAKDSVADAAVHPFDQTRTWAFQDADDVDVFQFTTLPDPDIFYVITWSYAGVGHSSANFSLYEDTDYFQSVFKDQGAGNGQTATQNLQKLKPSHTYYIRANLYRNFLFEENYQPKNYTIHIAACKDDVKDSGKDAARIEVGKKVSKALQNQFDQDVFKFTTPDTDSFYWLDATSLYSGGRLSFSIFDNQELTGDPIVNMIVDPKKTNSNRLAKLKRKTEYYVRAGMYVDRWGDYDAYTGTADYNFTVTSRLDDANNKVNNGDDQMKNATAISLGKKVTKALQDNDDVDYFTFKTTKDDNFYKMSFDNAGKCTMYCEIWDNNNFVGQAVAKRYIESKKSEIFDLAKLKKTHTYYVIVRRNWSDGFITSEKYMMKLTASKDDAKDTISSAKTLSLSKAYKFGIQNKADEDWFKFKTSGYTSYTVDFSNISCKGNVWITVYSGKEALNNQILLDQACAEKRSVDPNRAVLKLKPNRTYYVRIKNDNWWGAESGRYQLGIYASGPASAKAQKAVKKKKPEVTLSWQRVNKADGYYIFRAQKKKGKPLSYSSKPYKTIKKGSIQKFTDKKVKKGQTYYYKIQAYKNKKGGGKEKSAFSNLKHMKI